MKTLFSLTVLTIISFTMFAQTEPLEFNKAKADYLYHFAYECIDQEYPNKPNGVLGDDSFLLPPREIHPAFYGCFDWHSSVHGHWTLVTLLNRFPNFEYREEILAKLQKNITAENIKKEIDYFHDGQNNTFRTIVRMGMATETRRGTARMGCS